MSESVNPREFSDPDRPQAESPQSPAPEPGSDRDERPPVQFGESTAEPEHPPATAAPPADRRPERTVSFAEAKQVEPITPAAPNPLSAWFDAMTPDEKPAEAAAPTDPAPTPDAPSRPDPAETTAEEDRPLLALGQAGNASRWPRTTTEESPTPAPASPPASPPPSSSDTSSLPSLQQQEAELKRAIAQLQTQYADTLKTQMAEAQATMNRVMVEGVRDLEQRRNTLKLEIEQLERRLERIRAEMRQTFSGASQDLAVRVQGFKDYLVGSLQDLATVAERMQLPDPAAPPRDRRGPRSGDRPSPPDRDQPRERIRPRPEARIPRDRQPPRSQPDSATLDAPKFTTDPFESQTRRIRGLLDQYRTRPDYYGAPWRLRRTFEPIHAERVSDWFFKQGGRGAVRSMGSRMQNILVSSAAISVLREMYRDRVSVLVLIDSPERLGEWRRGLQDCLGISRGDFSAGGVVLFEEAEPLAQRAERITERGGLPLIVVDEAEDKISLSILQFPLWLAFAPNPTPSTGYASGYTAPYSG